MTLLRDQVVRNRKRIGRIVGDSRWAHYYFQKSVHSLRLRQVLGRVLAQLNPRPAAFPPCAELDRVSSELRSDGLSMLTDFISDQQVRDIREYLSAKPCFDPQDPSRPGFYDPARAHRSCFHAYYNPDDVAHVPHLWTLLNDPIVIGSISRVMKCRPTISIVSIWWLLAGYDGSSQAEAFFRENVKRLHRDVDDWVQIKLFIYLTDVDEGRAPHMFLKGSHNGGAGPGTRSMLLDIARKDYPTRLATIYGKAGTAFLDDAFGFHVGSWPEQGNRLVLAASYSLFPIPFGAVPKPIRVPDLSKTLDPYTNRMWLQL